MGWRARCRLNMGRGGRGWVGWLPHLDLGAARALTLGSADHDGLRSAVQQAGELRLSTQLDLRDMLRPAVQPGAKIDYEWPAEHVTLTFISDDALAVTCASGAATADQDGQGRNRVRVKIDPKQGELVPLQVTLGHMSGRWPELEVWYHTAEDARPRALALRRRGLTWVSVREVAGVDEGRGWNPQI